MTDKNLLVGFPSSGLVGGFAISVLADKMEMDLYSDLDFAEVSPMYLIDDGKVRGPITVYKKGDVFAAISNIPLDVGLAKNLAKSVLEFAKKEGISQLIIPRGLEIIGRQISMDKSFGFILSKDGTTSPKEHDLEELKHATLIGPEAGLVSELRHSEIPSLFMFTPCKARFPDTSATVQSITMLAKILDVKINTADIKEKLTELQKQNEEFVEEAKKAMQEQKGKTRIPSSMYR